MRDGLHQTPIEIGYPLLITSPSSNAKNIEQMGYLQLRKSGAFCVDVDPKFRPAKGSPVRVRASEGSSAQSEFSSHMTGRIRLNGHQPVVIIRN
tara:strand:+ start:266 stop:547 length:282 start_codon:yes stop_codon:yes gene_type:complete